jgi:large subunit ribosomal protein L4
VHLKLSALHPMTKGWRKHFVPLSSHVFGIEPRRDVLHSAVVYYLDAQRSGTANTKTRGEVNFGGAKIRPQKGSGQARLGRRNNPLLRGGGVIHGPRPRDMSTKLPRRVRELALRSALSARWRAGDLVIVPNFTWDAPPRVTGELRRMLGSKGWDDALFLTAPRNPQSTGRVARPSASEPQYTPAQVRGHAKELANFVAAVNNIPRTELIELHELGAEQAAAKPKEVKKPGELHAYEVLRRRKLVCDLGAIEWLEEALGGAVWHPQAEADELAELNMDVESMLRELQAMQAAQSGEAEQVEQEEILDAADVLVEEAGVPRATRA